MVGIRKCSLSRLPNAHLGVTVGAGRAVAVSPGISPNEFSDSRSQNLIKLGCWCECILDEKGDLLWQGLKISLPGLQVKPVSDRALGTVGGSQTPAERSEASELQLITS